MSTDSGSRSRTDLQSGEPGSETIALSQNSQQTIDVRSRTLDTVVAAEKLASGACNLLRLYRKRPEPRPDALIDDARTRLRLALEQLGLSSLDAAADDSDGEHCHHPGSRSNCTFPACECGLRAGWRS